MLLFSNEHSASSKTHREDISGKQNSKLSVLMHEALSGDCRVRYCEPRNSITTQLIAVLWIQIVISGYGLRNLPQFGSGSEPFHRNTSSISRGGEDFPTIFYNFFLYQYLCEKKKIN